MIISGTSFGTALGTVYIGSVEANVVSWTDSQIEVDVALIPAGIHDVFVTTINGRATDGSVNTFCLKLPFLLKCFLHIYKYCVHVYFLYIKAGYCIKANKRS